MNQAKALEELLKAPPEKRYKSFLNTVADLEKVWLLSSEDGFATYDDKEYIHLLVWPKKEFCLKFALETESPIDMEVHDFIERCNSLDDRTRFMVFPTLENTYVVTPEQLRLDIMEHLKQVE